MVVFKLSDEVLESELESWLLCGFWMKLFVLFPPAGPGEGGWQLPAAEPRPLPAQPRASDPGGWGGKRCGSSSCCCWGSDSKALWNVVFLWSCCTFKVAVPNLCVHEWSEKAFITTAGVCSYLSCWWLTAGKFVDSQKHKTKRGSPSRKIFLPEGYWRIMETVKENIDIYG